MSDPNKLSLIELYNEIERLYLKERFVEIIELEATCLKMDLSSLDSDQERALTEIFARAYMKLNRHGVKPGLIRQFKSSIRYAHTGGQDSDMLNWKLSLEEALFMRYVKVNKYILYLILLAVLLVNLDLLPSNNDSLPVLTGIAVVWYLLNYVMNCRVKRLYLGLMRYIYS